MDYISGVLNLSSMDQPLNCKGLLGISSTFRCLTFMIVCKGGQGYMIIFQLILIWHHIHFVYFICMCSLSLCRTFPLFSLYESSCREYWYWLWICNTLLKYLNLYGEIKCTWLCICFPWLVPSWIMHPSLTWKLPFFIEIEAVSGQV